MARNKLLKYDPETDYQAIIDKAALDGDFELAGEAETLRNRKIDETGSDYKKTYDFIKSPTEQAKGNQYAQDNPLGAVNFMNNYNVQKPTYNDTYGKQLDDALDKVLNRKDFSYDVASDPLYQQLANMYKREGNRAMEDTLAQAAINAGGMNSYAIGAAQQAANYYNSQLNDKIPELERLAYEMYLQDNEQDLRDLDILQGLQTAEYNKFRNILSDFYTERNNQYGAFVDDYNAKAKADATRLENERYDQETALKNERYAAETALENERYDRETAKEDIWNLIALGINPTDAELIARSGMSQDDIKRAANEAQRQNYEKYKSEDEGYYGGGAVPQLAAGVGVSPDFTTMYSGALTDTVPKPTSSTGLITTPEQDAILKLLPGLVANAPEDTYAEVDDFLSGVMQTEGFDAVKSALDDAFDTGILDKSTYNKLLEKYQYMQ